MGCGAEKFSSVVVAILPWETSLKNNLLIKSAFGLALLIFLGSAAQAGRTSISLLLCYSLSVFLLVLVYDLLNHQIIRCQQAEANYQDLYNNAPCGYHSTDKDGNFIAINDTELNWLGYSRDEVIGKLKITDLLTPESRVIFQENFESFLELGWVKDLEIQMIRNDGTILPALWKTTVIRDGAGNFVATRTTVFDITQRKQTEEMLRQSKERFRLAVDNIPDGFVIYDADRRLQFVNAEGLRRTGLSEEGLCGYTDEEIHPPEVYEKYLPTLQQAIETRTTQTTECTITLPVTGTFTVVVTYVPLLNEKGEIYQILGISNDITARKQAEEDLRQSEEQLRLALEAAHMGIWDWNVLTNQVKCSSDYKQLFGLATRTFGTYEIVEACIHPEDRKLVKQAVKQARQQRQDYHQEFRILRPDGTTHWIEGKGKFFYDQIGQAVRMLGTVMEISDRKAREEQLRLLESVVLNTNDAVLITEAEPIDLPGPRIVYANEAFTQLTGYSLEEVFGQTPRILQGVNTDRPTLARIRVALETWQPIRVDLINYRKDGSEFWVDLSLVPVANERGWFTHWISVQRDISDRKQAEVALQQSEERFRRAILDAPLPIILYAEDGEVLQINSAWTELTGYTHQELSTLAEWTKKAYGETQEFVGADIEHLYTLNQRIAQGESIVTTHDGETRIWEFYSAPLGKLPDGRRQAISMALDITKRKLAEAELQESEKKFRQFAENIDQVLWMSDVVLNEILYVSPAYEQIWGRSCESLYANPKSFFDPIHPDDRQRVITNIELNHGSNEFDIEYRLIRPDGAVRWIRDRGFPVHNESGEVYRRAGIAQDITAQKQSEIVLRQVNEELEIRVAERTAELQQANARLQEELFERQQVEQSLQRTYQRLQFHVENTPLAFIEWNSEFRVINWSKQAENIFGWTIEEVLNNHPNHWRFVYDEDIEQVNAMIEDLVNGYQPRNLNRNRNYTKNGMVIDCEWYNSALFDESGNLVSILSLVQDITDRKRAEAALRESQQQLQAILDNSPAVIYLVDADNRHLLINRGYENLVSMTNEQIVGKSVYDVWPHKLADVYAENNRKVLEAGKPIEVEEVAPQQDGLHTYMTIKFPLYDANGIPYAVCGISTDITERKQAEEALRSSEARFRRLFESNIVGVIFADFSGQITDANDLFLQMVGYTRQELLAGNMRWDTMTPPEYRDRDRDAIQQSKATGVGVAWEKELICSDGSRVPVLIGGALVEGSEGLLIAFVLNISDRKRAEAALRQAYDELEIRVHQRTMQLFKANEELQIENAERRRVEAELKTRAKQQAAVAELGQQALAGKQLDRLMNQAVAQIAQILKVEYCKVLELLPDENALLLKVGVGWKEGLVGQEKVSLGPDCQAGYTLLSNEPVVVEDLRQEERFPYPCMLHQHEVVSGLSVIIPGQNYPYGVLAAHTTSKRKFTEDDVHFLQATANVLATAINRQQAEAALRRAHDELEIRVQERTQDLAKANLELQQKIIERQQAEEERAKLIAILEATPDIVVSVGVDNQSSYGAATLTHYLNSAARKLFGLAEDEDCTNFSLSKAYPDWAYQLVHNEGIPAAMRDGVWVGETAFLSHDEWEIPVSQLIIAHKSPDGSVKLISTVARDITQQKKIAATLFEAERRWRSLLENVRLVVVGLDSRGKVEYVNPYFLELVGYTKAEVIGKDWFETFLPPHQRNRGQNNFIELLEKEFYTHNQNILTKSGEERVIAWNNTLLQDLQGYVIGTLSIGEDITERQVIERMKDEFISVVSHELRTPLTSIHGALNLLSSGLVNTQSEKGRRVIEIAAESAERLVRLVNDILELERLESGKISLSKQMCNAAELIRQATEMMQVMANRSGITLSVSPRDIQIEADPDRIIQVLTNLLGNAIKFSSQGSTVCLTVELQDAQEISCVVQGFANCEQQNFTLGLRPAALISPHPYSPTKPQQVLFQVKDQGRGIPADKLETIFERFHQVDASDSRKKGGTGLGLAICRSIVQQHGGRIWVESTLGEGSSFYFTLPGPTVEDDKHGNQANLGD